MYKKIYLHEHHLARYVQHGSYSQIRYVYSGILMVSHTTKYSSVVSLYSKLIAYVLDILCSNFIVLSDSYNLSAISS